MKKILYAAFACLLIFAMVSCVLSQEEAKKYEITFEGEDNIEKATERVTTIDPPKSLKIDGHEFTLTVKDDFNKTLKEVEENWDTHKVGDFRKGTNFWDDAALKMANEKDESKNYLQILTTQKKFKDLGVYEGLTPEDKAKKEKKFTDKGFTDESDCFVSGAIKSKKNYKYGLFVGRLKLEKGSAGHWNAFWTYNSTHEFDIFEFSRRYRNYPLNQKFDQTTHYINYNVSGGANNPKYKHTDQNIQTIDDVSQWHTYAVLWTPEEYVYYIDWEPTYCVAKYKDGTYGGNANALKEKKLMDQLDRPLVPTEPTKVYYSTEIAQGISWSEAWTGGKLDLKELPDSLDVDYFAWYTNAELKAAAKGDGTGIFADPAYK